MNNLLNCANCNRDCKDRDKCKTLDCSDYFVPIERAEFDRIKAELDEAKHEILEWEAAGSAKDARNKRLKDENEKLKKVIHEQGKCLASIKYNIKETE